MNSITSSLFTRQDNSSLTNFQSARLSQSSLDTRASASLSLVTADGDKVTLSANSSIQASLKTYDYLGRVQGQSLATHQEEFEVSAKRGFAVSVEGSLDQAELADITKLVDTLAALGKDFFAGKTEDGLAHLGDLDNLDSIASFNATLSYSRTSSRLAASQTSGDAPAPSVNHSAKHATARLKGLSAFIDQLTQAAKLLEADKGLDSIPDRISQLFKKLAQELPLNKHEHDLAHGIESELAKRAPEHHADSTPQQAS